MHSYTTSSALTLPFLPSHGSIVHNTSQGTGSGNWYPLVLVSCLEDILVDPKLLGQISGVYVAVPSLQL